MFTQPKSPLMSLGVLGGSGAVLLGIAQLVGWSLTPNDAAELSDGLKGLATSVAGIVAVIGRIRATKRISLTG
ncbi:hypothetical protein [uncultured Sulfitobacter sp.]|uniref:hypothetical protein n=1 Tax=uncultured Sulfitobacter sp. TaxID=191468 RepID=UPI0030DC94BC